MQKLFFPRSLDAIRNDTGFMLKSTPRANSPSVESENHLALRTLFESEESHLLRYAFYLTGRRAVAEEIVQEVFLDLYKKWAKVDTPRAWLFRSVLESSLQPSPQSST